MGEPRPGMPSIRCDRCALLVEGSVDEDCSYGVYFVAEGSGWEKFADVWEIVVCDLCMWQDPRYIAVYGRHTFQQTEDKQ